VIESFPNPSLLEPQSWKTFYEGLIRDKFPAAPLYLIERFAEGNILVHKKLWPIHAEESTPLDTPSRYFKSWMVNPNPLTFIVLPYTWLVT
jgi:hypothetical protein